jgi:hypothetical protein
VLYEHATRDIFIDVDAERLGDPLGDAHAADARIPALQLDNRRDQFCRGAFGARFAATVAGGEARATFPVHQGLVEFEERCPNE